MKHTAQTLLYVGALWGSQLNTDSDSAWMWAWESAFFFCLPVISVPLGSLTNPLLGMIRPEKLKHTDFESYTAQMSWKQFCFSKSVQGKKFKNWLQLFKRDFFLEWNIISLQVSHHHFRQSMALLRSSVDKNAFAHSVRFLPFRKCFLGSVYSSALNEKNFTFFYFSKFDVYFQIELFLINAPNKEFQGIIPLCPLKNFLVMPLELCPRNYIINRAILIFF